MIVLVVVRQLDNVALGDAGEVAQSVFQHGAGVRNFEEIDMLRLELDEGGLGQTDVGNGNEGALFDQQILHHPERDEDAALLGCEFQHAAVRFGALFGILQTEQHGIINLETGQDVKGRRWEEDLVTSLFASTIVIFIIGRSVGRAGGKYLEQRVGRSIGEMLQ